MSLPDELPDPPLESADAADVIDPAAPAASGDAATPADADATDQWSPDLPMPLDPGSLARVLRFRGGPFDGATWRGEIAVGARLACGPGPWTPESIYVVTDDMVQSLAGETEFVAVPGEAGPRHREADVPVP